jgi:hypothetical protein
MSDSSGVGEACEVEGENRNCRGEAEAGAEEVEDEIRTRNKEKENRVRRPCPRRDQLPKLCELINHISYYYITSSIDSPVKKDLTS